MYKTVGDTAIRTYDVFCGPSTSALLDIGLCDEPKVAIEQVTGEIKLTQMHGQVMGHRLLGVKITLSFMMREITLANLVRAFPWAGESDDAGLTPTKLGVDLYDYAKAWKFHPRDLADNDTTQDFILLRGTPIGPLNLGDQGGEQDAAIPMTVAIYPDRSKLPTIQLGWIGSNPLA